MATERLSITATPPRHKSPSGQSVRKSPSPSPLGKPPKPSPSPTMRTPESRRYITGGKQESFGFEGSPSRFAPGGLEVEIGAIGLLDGFESLSPIAHSNAPSPALSPTHRMQSKMAKQQSLQHSSFKEQAISTTPTKQVALSVIAEDDSESPQKHMTPPTSLPSSPARRRRSTTNNKSPLQQRDTVELSPNEASPKVSSPARQTQRKPKRNSTTKPAQSSPAHRNRRKAAKNTEEQNGENEATPPIEAERRGGKRAALATPPSIKLRETADPVTDESQSGGEEIEAARNLVGVSSRFFIDQLRGAAFRRKKDLARSRDSLVAKEKVQREALATSKSTQTDSNGDESESNTNTRAQGSVSSQQHQQHNQAAARPSSKARSRLAGKKASSTSGIPKTHARPSTIPRSPKLGKRRQSASAIPATRKPLQDVRNGALDARRRPKEKGCVGLQRVEKRQVTVPVSPKLGARKAKPTNTRSSMPTKTTSGCATFKARPLPKTMGGSRKSGTPSVSRVTKRQVTTAVSPLLGSRRPKPKVDSPKNAAPHSESIHKQLSSSGLLGIDFIQTPTPTNEQNALDMKTPRPRRHTMAPGDFIPHSTLRAQKRAEFEVSRRQHEIEREEQASQHLRAQVRVLHKELCSLQKKI